MRVITLQHNEMNEQSIARYMYMFICLFTTQGLLEACVI